MKPFILHASARRELREAASFYEAERSGLGERWLAALAAVTRKVQSNPKTGRSYGLTTRQCRVLGFPYVVVFENRADDIHVVAIAHLRRRPGQRIDRLEDSET